MRFLVVLLLVSLFVFAATCSGASSCTASCSVCENNSSYCVNCSCSKGDCTRNHFPTSSGNSWISLSGDCFEVIKKRAEQGDDEGQLDLGMYYGTGPNPRDLVEAMKWYLKSAEQGNNRAQSILGYIYIQGKAVTKDEVESLAWYYVAAAFGNDYSKNVNIPKYEKSLGADIVLKAQKRSKVLISEIEARKSAKKNESILKPK